jgi:hypothetical protein
MSVAVYPRLSELLRSRQLTVAELERQIKQRFGIRVDAKTLYRLAHAEPVQRADLEIAGAAAAVLGVGLGDLFEVQAIPVDQSLSGDAEDLSPEQSQRLAWLFDRSSRGELTPVEREEMEALVAEFGRLLHERQVRELASQRHVSVEEARRTANEQLDGALEWWRAFEADPQRRKVVEAQARRKRGRAQE